MEDNEYKREENFNQVYKDLEEKDKKEIKELVSQLEKIEKENKNEETIIKDKKLKNRIAKLCLKLIEETPKDKTSIMETSFIINGNFIYYKYGDKLDNAIDISGELELPEEHVSGDVFKLWGKMKKIFGDYIKNKK